METRLCPTANPCPEQACARFESDDPAPWREPGQAWTQADYHCGRCGVSFTAATEAEYVTKYSAHQIAHDLLDAATPELRTRIIDAALASVQGGEAGL